MNTRNLVSSVFSPELFDFRAGLLWRAHLDWLAELGWADAHRKESVQLPAPSGHEVVDMLNRFVVTAGLVNAHTGLTSSDIVDNVRLMQVREGLGVLSESLLALLDQLHPVRAACWPTVGFTHWQIAAPITWSHRGGAWCAPLAFLQAAVPAVYAKKFGGPVGDGASLKLLVGEDKLNDNPFNWESFGLEYPCNPHPLQSSDHTCEIAAINWVCAVAAQLHKIAQDLRFLAAFGLVVPEQGEQAGSSSMPHKVNPFKWEKVCGLCRSVSTTQSEMWAVAAHNSLERTLDTSWQLKALLERAFLGLAEALDTMHEVEIVLPMNRSAELLRDHRDQLSSDADLTRQVLAGKSRFAAYQESLARRNAP